MRGISNHVSPWLRFMCGLRVDGLAFFIQPYYFLHIMQSEKRMTSAFTNVRAVKAKIVPLRTVTEAQHYTLTSCIYIQQCTRQQWNVWVKQSYSGVSLVPIFKRIIYWPLWRGGGREIYPLPHQLLEVRVPKLFGANDHQKGPIQSHIVDSLESEVFWSLELISIQESLGNSASGLCQRNYSFKQYGKTHFSNIYPKVST